MFHFDPDTVKDVGKVLLNFLLVGLGSILWNLLTPQKTWETLRGLAFKSWKANRIAWLQMALKDHLDMTLRPHRALAKCIHDGTLAIISASGNFSLWLLAELGNDPGNVKENYRLIAAFCAGVAITSIISLLMTVDRITTPSVRKEKLLKKLKRLGWEPAAES